LKFSFPITNPAAPKSSDISLSLLYTDAPMLLAYKLLTGVYTVTKYSDITETSFKALVSWGEEYGSLIGFYETPTGCTSCRILNSATLQMKMPYFGVNSPKKIILTMDSTPTAGYAFIYPSSIRSKVQGGTCLV
jgi:hypothetical protein